MARYRGTVKGNRGEASRLGTKASGLLCRADGWGIGAAVTIAYNDETAQDEVFVYITKGSSSNNTSGFVLGTYTTREDGSIIRIR